MKTVVLVTDSDFWRGGAGHKSRILSLAIYLGNYVKLVIIYSGRFYPEDYEVLKGRNFKVFPLNKNKATPKNEYLGTFKQYLSRIDYDICILEYIELSFLLDCIPKNKVIILDTHDLKSQRQTSFNEFGYNHDTLTLEEEIEIFNKYDYLLFINESDQEIVQGKLEDQKVILAPHPTKVTRREVRKDVRTIAFVGSDYIPNKDGLLWFLTEVWPEVFDGKITLKVFGNVVHLMDLFPYKGVEIVGFVPDINEMYDQADIVVNPVRFGAGLKIKNVEALGNGVPLVTTRHSARGLAKGKGTAFLVADDADSFIDTLKELIPNHEMRQSLSSEGYKFVEEYFTPDTCFTNLLKVINV